MAQSWLNTALDVPKNAYLYANDLANKGLEYSGFFPTVRAVGGAISRAGAESDYQEAHGGQYPASQEELNAWISSGGTTQTKQNAERAINGGALPVGGTLPSSGPSGQPDAEAPPQVTGVIPAPQDMAQKKINDGVQQEQLANQAINDAIAKGGAQVPDAASDPAGHLAARNQNQAAGVGDTGGNLNVPRPTPPSQKEQQDMDLHKTGQQANFDQNKIPEWYQSKSFGYGLITFGLNLLSGNDLAQSFALAGNAFTGAYGTEKRSIWAQDLHKQGYNPAEVEQWVQTGDAKVLTDPVQKEFQRAQQTLQLQTGKEQLSALQYENDPARRQQALLEHQQDRDLSRLNIMSEMQARQLNATNQAQRNRLDLIEHQAKIQGLNQKAADNLAQQSTQLNAVATQKQETDAIGQGILNDPSLKYAGSTYKQQASRWLSNKAGEGQGVQLDSLIENYNHKLTNAGMANLYAEAGGSRIFAKEMENAGKNYRTLRVDMTPQQIQEAIQYNAEITNRLVERANDLNDAIVKGSHPTHNYENVSYEDQSRGGNAPSNVSGAGGLPGLKITRVPQR